jgi:hypothetical protein
MFSLDPLSLILMYQGHAEKQSWIVGQPHYGGRDEFSRLTQTILLL